ncbi:MAG: caspase family protein [Muribaculaceae bacterium]|nr:caspase family protein [Muribaculaceae bacterium]
MKKLTSIFLSVASVLAGVVVAHGFGGPEVPDSYSDMQDAVVDSTLVAFQDSINLDSLREVRRVERLVNAADSTYRRLRSMRFDGYDEKEFFPLVYDCYEANVRVIDSLPDHERFGASKAALLDIYKDLLDGAYYYSSAGQSALLTKYAQAYLDLQDMPCMEGERFYRDNRAFPTLAYNAASGAYNDKDYERAIRYFDTYLSTDSEQQRENVYIYLGQACILAKDYDHGVKSMAEALVLYPANYNIITLGLQCCIDGDHGEMLQHFLDKGLMLRPDDEQLLNVQGQIHEDRQEYKQALEVFSLLNELKPNNMSIVKHLALNYFNLGVNYYNDAIMQQQEKAAKRSKRQSNAYFNEAVNMFETILANDPLAVKYLKSLAVAYGCMGMDDKFEEVNNRIRALGYQPEKSVMPAMIAFNEDNTQNFKSQGGAPVRAGEVPSYSEFGKAFVTDGLAKWAQRGQFEKSDAYAARINDLTAQAEYKRLCMAAEDEYIRQYGGNLRITDLKLGKYDPDNEVYLINSEFGDIVLPVPMKGGEAQVFASTWDRVNLRAPKFYIKNDRPAISALTFVTPAGKTYTYNAEDGATYAYTDVSVDFNSIIDNKSGTNLSTADAAGGNAVKKVTRQSDVDLNIPIVRKVNENAVALIIANENYRNVSNVASALHDGEVVAEYCHKVLGIPEHRVKYYSDASLASILEALADTRNTVDALNGDVDLIVYYAGHGMPDEHSKDAYLIPVDGNATIAETCYSLERFYKQLEDMKARSTMVFIDACFSGAQRGDGMLVGARGVAIKPKTTVPKGDMFVLSAATGQETAMPYRDKNHGLFTYYLLKKLQTTKGNTTLKELADYVTTNVREQSNAINKKPQNPTVSLSGKMSEIWETKKMR